MKFYPVVVAILTFWYKCKICKGCHSPTKLNSFVYVMQWICWSSWILSHGNHCVYRHDIIPYNMTTQILWWFINGKIINRIYWYFFLHLYTVACVWTGSGLFVKMSKLLLTSNEQCLSNFMARTIYRYVQWNDEVHFLQGQHTSWIFIVLAHWNSSPLVDMSLHLDTLFWIRANQSLLDLLLRA